MHGSEPDNRSNLPCLPPRLPQRGAGRDWAREGSLLGPPLTAGIDCADDRLEVVICGWSRDGVGYHDALRITTHFPFYHPTLTSPTLSKCDVVRSATWCPDRGI